VFNAHPETWADLEPSIEERLSRFNFHNRPESSDPEEFFTDLVRALEEFVRTGQS
jgi:hypothetical protein